MEKRKGGSNIFFAIILRLLGRISSREEGKGDGICGEVNQVEKKWVGRISSFRELYTPLETSEDHIT